MMYYFNDLTGKTFGKLTVIKIAGRDKHRRMLWLCECKCGNEIVVNSCSLVTGNTKSCGCGKYGNNKKYGDIPSHKQRLYRIWCGIKDRCLNPKNRSYHYYGGRGIKICEQWVNNYPMFRKWALGNGYEEELTIDRIDVNGGYAPDNCRWVDMKAQANNRGNSHYLTFNGKTLTISEWARETGLNEYLIRQRIWKGWKPDRALSESVRVKRCHKKLSLER